MSANCLAFSRRSAKEPHSAVSGRKNRARLGRKVQSLRVPPGKIIKAQAMLIQGDSQREIARTLHMSEHSVAKVVRAENFQNFLREQQERLFAIAPDALESFRAQVKMDGYLAYAFLKDLGIIPSREAIVSLMNPASPQTETGEERQARMVACVLLEGNANFDVDLPDDVAKALARESEECTQIANPQRKLLRK